MKAGPDIALVASLVGDPARANMLTALMGGHALTATELAQEAGISPQTASSHLTKLSGGGLLMIEKQGRLRYYRLTGPDVAALLESLMGIAARAGHLRTRTGPKDPALRRARVCYDHLAGEFGVRMFDGLCRRRFLRRRSAEFKLTRAGQRLCDRLEIDIDSFQKGRRPICKPCLDWSERRSHLAGALGAALLARFYQLKWARREPGTRIVTFTHSGEREFARLFG